MNPATTTAHGPLRIGLLSFAHTHAEAYVRALRDDPTESVNRYTSQPTATCFIIFPKLEKAWPVKNSL